MTAITREARLYAVKELARRAGVGVEFFRTWKVESDDRETHVFLQPGTPKRIRFPNASLDLLREFSRGAFCTARAAWMRVPPAPLSDLVPDFVIPFAHEANQTARPLFAPVDGDCVECAFDLPLATLLSLSRWEETLPGKRDQHGRFSSSMSVAGRDGFLTRPVVDEWGLALEQALLYLLPAWPTTERKLRVKLSHDIDEIGIPFNPRSTVGHILRRHRPLATAQDLLSWLPGISPTLLELVRQIVRISLERGLDSAVYWKASPRGPWDSGYDPRSPKVRDVIDWLHKHGVETGVHPGYDTFGSPEALRREIEILREALGQQPLGGRQHYLRWCPDTWRHWEDCGLAYDSSLGYADHIGFRAGTCIPYRPWLVAVNREARLIEIPLIVMEGTLLHYMHLDKQQSFEVILECVTRCRAVGGVFTLLWHNTTLLDPLYDGLYESILGKLNGHSEFDWMTPSIDLY